MLRVVIGGGRAVIRARLNRFIEVAEVRHVTIQVVPFGRDGHAAAGGSFTVRRFSEPDMSGVVCTGRLTSALYLDKREDVNQYAEAMNHLSTEALTPAETRRFLAEIITETEGHKLVSSPMARQADSRPQKSAFTDPRKPQLVKDSL